MPDTPPSESKRTRREPLHHRVRRALSPSRRAMDTHPPGGTGSAQKAPHGGTPANIAGPLIHVAGAYDPLTFPMVQHFPERNPNGG